MGIPRLEEEIGRNLSDRCSGPHHFRDEAPAASSTHSSCSCLLGAPSHPGGEVEGAQPLAQGRLQLLQGPVPPAVGQRGDVVPLSGPQGSQQQASEVLSLQQRRHVLQEVALAEGAQLRGTVGLGCFVDADCVV